MSLIISEECIMCDVCEPECSNGAISRGADAYVIDQNLCTECAGQHAEPQCAEVCPINCIKQNPLHAKKDGGIYKKFSRLFK